MLPLSCGVFLYYVELNVLLVLAGYDVVNLQLLALVHVHLEAVPLLRVKIEVDAVRGADNGQQQQNSCGSHAPSLSSTAIFSLYVSIPSKCPVGTRRCEILGRLL